MAIYNEKRNIVKAGNIYRGNRPTITTILTIGSKQRFSSFHKQTQFNCNGPQPTNNKIMFDRR